MKAKTRKPLEFPTIWSEVITPCEHPRTGEAGWMRSIIQAPNESDLGLPIKQRLSEGWKVWIIGRMKHGAELVHAVVMFRHASKEF